MKQGGKGRKIGRKKRKGIKSPLTSSIAKTPMLAKGATWNDSDLQFNPAWTNLVSKNLRARVNE